MSVYIVSFKQRPGRDPGVPARLAEAMDRYTHTRLSDSCYALATLKDIDMVWAELSSALPDGLEALHVFAVGREWKGAGGKSGDQWLGIHLDGAD